MTTRKRRGGNFNLVMKRIDRSGQAVAQPNKDSRIQAKKDHTHTRTRAHHTRTYTHTHTRTHTHTHTHTSTHLHIYTSTHTRAHIHTHTRAHKKVHNNECVGAHVRTRRRPNLLIRRHIVCSVSLMLRAAAMLRADILRPFCLTIAQTVQQINMGAVQPCNGRPQTRYEFIAPLKCRRL